MPEPRAIDRINSETRFAAVLRRPDGSLCWSKDTVGRTVEETVRLADFTNKAYPPIGVVKLEVTEFAMMDDVMFGLRSGSSSPILI